MKTLDEIISAPIPPIETLRKTWLAFPASLAAHLSDAQSTFSLHRATPIKLTDGRLALCADLLSEIDGGIFALPFSRLPTEFFTEVEVIDAADITSPDIETES
jgi:hypothetical protein